MTHKQYLYIPAGPMYIVYIDLHVPVLLLQIKYESAVKINYKATYTQVTGGEERL